MTRLRTSGSFIPDPIYANIGKLMQGTHIYDMFRIVHDTSGGIIVASPYPEDMELPSVKERLDRYLQGREDIPADYRISVARLLEDITASYQGGWYSAISISGGGSPEATRLEIMRKYDIDERKSLIEKISGV